MDRGRKWFEMLVAEGRRCGAVRADVPADLSAEVIWSMTEAADRWLAGTDLILVRTLGRPWKASPALSRRW